MPELPEVETIVRELKSKISGKEIQKFFIFDKRLGKVRLPLPLKINSVVRHGKFIVLAAKNGKILIHLRMTGRILFSKDVPSMPEKWERARFYFVDGSTSLTTSGLALRFFDPRRFGTLEWRKGKLPEIGIGPLSREFDEKKFHNILSSKSRAIRSLLLDQKVIAGLGTIYSDEALWFAKIDPRRKSDSLSKKEAGMLLYSIKKVLREAIKKGGSTMRDYRKTSGEAGRYQLFRKVYGREGLLCSRCRSKIERIKIGGRSTHFCGKCQKLKK